MNNSIWEVIAETPWWFYLLFIYLLNIARLLSRTRIMPIKNLIIFPAIFFALSLIGIFFMIKLNVQNILIYFEMLLLGSFLGWLHFRLQKIKALKNEAKLVIPGSWTLAVIVIILFATRFYFRYELLQINPDILRQPEYASYFMLFYGLITGLFLGRLAFAIHCYKRGPYFSDPAAALSTQ